MSSERTDTVYELSVEDLGRYHVTRDARVALPRLAHELTSPRFFASCTDRQRALLLRSVEKLWRLAVEANREIDELAAALAAKDGAPLAGELRSEVRALLHEFGHGVASGVLDVGGQDLKKLAERARATLEQLERDCSPADDDDDRPEWWIDETTKSGDMVGIRDAQGDFAGYLLPKAARLVAREAPL